MDRSSVDKSFDHNKDVVIFIVIFRRKLLYHLLRLLLESVKCELHRILLHRLFYYNLLEEILDLNKPFSIFSKTFFEEVRNDYFVIIHRTINGSKKIIHFLLYEGVRAQTYIRVFSLHLQTGLD
jgi:hypothetical protein